MTQNEDVAAAVRHRQRERERGATEWRQVEPDCSHTPVTRATLCHRRGEPSVDFVAGSVGKFPVTCNVVTSFNYKIKSFYKIKVIAASYIAGKKMTVA